MRRVSSDIINVPSTGGTNLATWGNVSLEPKWSCMGRYHASFSCPVDQCSYYQLAIMLKKRQGDDDKLQTTFTKIQGDDDKLQTTFTKIQGDNDKSQTTFTKIQGDNDKLQTTFTKIQGDNDKLQTTFTKRLDAMQDALNQRDSNVQKLTDLISAKTSDHNNAITEITSLRTK